MFGGIQSVQINNATISFTNYTSGEGVWRRSRQHLYFATFGELPRVVTTELVAKNEEKITLSAVFTFQRLYIVMSVLLIENYM